MRQIRIAAFIAPSLASLGLLILAFAPEAGAAGLAATAKSKDGVWEKIDNRLIATRDLQLPAASSYRVLRLNKEALARQLARAPMERTGDLRNSPAILSLPMPDGSFQSFHIEESPVMDAELVARYPEIKSYRGQGIDDGTATVRFDWTPFGFHALVLSADHPAVNIQPPDRSDITTYASYYDQGAAFTCGVNESHRIKPGRAEGVSPNVAVGTTLRSERIAVAATWEFCNTIGGDTLAGSTAALNSFLNGLNVVYERELSVHMNLVNAPNIIYASNNSVCGPGNNVACNAGNDPYTNTNESTMLNEVRPDLRDKVGVANYDVGHVLGTGSSGIAFIGVICDDNDNGGDGLGPLKGAGATRVFAPAGNSGASGLWAHELGHQHGADHTQNGTTASCGGTNRNGPTAWETGSGITIMSYVGICGTDNISDTRDLRFHNGSYNEITASLAAGATCTTNAATGDNIPTVNAGTAKTIPKQTPFTLTATGTDADPADFPNLRFIWEQLDAGGTLYFNPPYGDQAGDPPTTTRPLFRAFSPIASNSRTFPSLTYILNNANVPPAVVGGFQTAENLPSVSRTMNFRTTVRDQRFGVNDSSVAITVDGNSGPFAVTSPNGAENWSGAQTVTWNVANTSSAPVSTANVKISLSTNGGQTFPTTLAASAPNSGTAAVTLPNGIISSTCRIKVEALGNIFFDISNANFNLTPADSCPAVSGISPKVGNVGNSVTITGVNFTGVNAVTFSNNVPATSFTVNSATQITATVPNGAVGGPITLSKPSCGNVQTSNFSVCSNPPVALSIDDGSDESFRSNGDGAYYVNRLTPATYPATLTQISIFWDPFQSFPPGTAINVVAGANAGGTANIDGTSFQTFAAIAGAQPGFTTYTLPNAITIMAGDFVIGFQVPTDPGFAIAVDTNNPLSRSYRSSNGTTFTNVTDGNYMIRAAQVFTGCDAGAPTLSQVVSRMTHGGAGDFDIVLPQPPATRNVECRSGGASNNFKMVFTFPNNLVSVAGASVTNGAGTVSSSALGPEANQYTVNLTGVTNAQSTTVTLANVLDSTSAVGNVPAIIGVLLGDTTGNGGVNSSDISQTKGQSGTVASSGNFRTDVTVNGSINSSDISTVKSKSGTALPP
jgi:hypothetical protein